MNRENEETTAAKNFVANVSMAFLGKEQVVENAILTLLCGGHLLLEDVPGVGKTLLAKAMARSVAADFTRIQFTADLLPSDITGVSIFMPDQSEFQFKPGPVFTNILLADEINRATPRTQSSLLEAMEEQSVSVDSKVHRLPFPFFVIATQNPVELEGTYPLPFAQMDRFMMRLRIGYLDKAAEMQMLRDQRDSQPLEKVSQVMTLDDLLRIEKSISRVEVSEVLLEYLLEIVTRTRNHPGIEYGASPRGSLDLQRCSQGRAFLAGRGYVLPDDVKAAARLVLPHRLISRKGVRSVALQGGEIIDEILCNVVVPV